MVLGAAAAAHILKLPISRSLLAPAQPIKWVPEVPAGLQIIAMECPEEILILMPRAAPLLLCVLKVALREIREALVVQVVKRHLELAP